MKTLCLIGAGKVGTVLGHLWDRSGMVQIQQVHTRTRQSAQAAIEKIGAGSVCENLNDLEVADMFFLALPDDKIVSLATKLLMRFPQAIFFHTSGTLPQISGVACVHPMFSFANFDYTIRNFNRAYCVAGGDARALDAVIPLFEATGSKVIKQAIDTPALYHSGLVFISNYLLTILSAGNDCLVGSGFSSQNAKKMMLPLIESVLEQAGLLNAFAEALTGPISRGDASTVTAHTKALRAELPELANLYAALGLRTVALANRQGLDKVSCEQLTQCLETIYE